MNILSEYSLAANFLAIAVIFIKRSLPVYLSLSSSGIIAIDSPLTLIPCPENVITLT